MYLAQGETDSNYQIKISLIELNTPKQNGLLVFEMHKFAIKTWPKIATKGQYAVLFSQQMVPMILYM